MRLDASAVPRGERLGDLERRGLGQHEVAMDQRYLGSAFLPEGGEQAMNGFGHAVSPRAPRALPRGRRGVGYPASASSIPFSASSWQSMQNRAQGTASRRSKAIVWPQLLQRP